MSHVYKVEYRYNDKEEWKHYYSSEIKGDALDMYAHHVSIYNKEQCQIRYIETMDLHEYKPPHGITECDDDE